MSQREPEWAIEDLVFAAFNHRVVALDRDDGTIVWEWKAPSGRGYVSLLLDGDRLIAGVNGHVYCLDPLFGEQVWRNPLKGFGVGVTSLASIRGSITAAAGAAQVAAQQQAAAAAGAAGAV